MNGILPLWKEKGMTSHDCVFKLRKILHTKKVGHTGTLDPEVEGVLPICIGRATKVASYITDAGKEYIAKVSIGRSTETEDAQGATVSRDDSDKVISREQLLEVLQQLTGEITQIPPMYSAVKVNGRRLYEYARKGIEVERPARQVHIEEIELLDEASVFSGKDVSFSIRVRCGKGTYIRTLAVQIGELFGYPAHMESLVRTVSGNFTQNDCKTLAEVAQLMEEGQVDSILRPVEDVLREFPRLEIDPDLLESIRNGQVLPAVQLLQEHVSVILTYNGQVLAIYKNHPTKIGLMKPEKMLLSNE
ncbi:MULTISPECIES: tRNA pseudouridine(55) synthase TruB [unclassified Sporosarcina]|uniref:tRNA pseudouridine(55) synthase TruB n=1 Tax=unclassified Sporosarcina TaxID=2647733 RepID=UPI00203AEED1|nr:MULTISPECIES: tRNA pseudouridine(55) synthase TruB [unclassified Sporosarcina]GKV64148.1 tRNA pseudouridine synthase B [Sporosarcina sp. NCCP-2331]GLB54387.1 tRNA pseudouridine synthase B [Sporosarcina sp. NCCP-2378]